MFQKLQKFLGDFYPKNCSENHAFREIPIRQSWEVAESWSLIVLSFA